MSKVIREKGSLPGSRGPKPAETGMESCQGEGVEVFVNGVPVVVSPGLEAAVLRVYRDQQQSLPCEMTTTQAAEFLDVSRPFIIKRINLGELPCRMVGKHRRIPSDALVEYREKMFRQARAAADEMAAISQEQGLDGLEAPAPGEP